MKFTLIKETKIPVPRRRIMKLFDLIEKGEKPPDSILNIVFIGDRRMKSLNQKYRGIPKTTDVLSFNIDDTAGKESIFGEIYISLETAIRYARADEIGADEMILRLCCHGFLHLLGYDHQKPKGRERMESREEYYLSRIIRRW